MPRRKSAIKREILSDPIFDSPMLARFINIVMRSGKKSVAEKIVYESLEEAAKRLKNKSVKKDVEETSVQEGSLEVLKRALQQVSPTVEVKSRRVGGITVQVPIPIDGERGIALAMRWLVESAKKRSEKGMMLRLALEIVEAYEGRGSAIKMRDDMHKMAKANQAFAHYRF
jgi:small subunit ribosomal protein S7